MSIITKPMSSRHGINQPKLSPFTLQKRFNSSFQGWSKAIPHPIQVFSVAEFGVNTKTFCKEQTPVFKKLPADYYDVRKEQIEFLRTRIPSFTLSQKVADYYTGKASFEVLEVPYKSLSDGLKREFDSIKPYRFRAVSQFELLFNQGSFKLTRLPSEIFVQEEALVQEESAFDYRKWPRIFTDLSEEAAALNSFKTVMAGVAERIHGLLPKIRGVSIVVHHVRLQTRVDRPADNSPEGIHQDGFPFIVSALIVEREKVVDGKSIIYGEDKETEILNTTLMPGMGILQPDLGSALWHKVTKVHVDVAKFPSAKEGFRSSIGFDIKPIF